MAKALHGYLSSTDPRAGAQVAAENRRLRQRVSDLEQCIRRLQAENDALNAERAERLLEDASMQPV